MKFKFISIFLLLLIPIVSANLYDYPVLELEYPYETYFSAYFIPSQSVIPLDEEVSFLFYIFLDDDLEHGLVDTDYNLYNNPYYFGVPTSSNYPNTFFKPTISYGVTDSSDIEQISINELPYYIKSCHIKCDDSDLLYDFSYYPSNYDYAESLEMNYDCEYSSEKVLSGEPVYMSIYCEIESVDDYASQGGYLDMGDLFNNERNRYALMTESGFTCMENPFLLGSSPPQFQDNGGGCSGYILEVFELVPVQTNEESFYYNGSNSSVSLRDYTWVNASETNLTNSGNELEGTGGSETKDKTKSEYNSKEKEKQKQFEQELSLIEKKNSFLLSLVSICVTLFSIILLTYYLFALLILGYLLSVLFPKIISLPYMIIHNFRKNKKGDL
jgi:hypothetical protein